jgi:hypothetical protein
MKKAIVSFIIIVILDIVFIQLCYCQELYIHKDGLLTIYVHGVEADSSFPVYIGKKLSSVKAGAGKILVLVKCVVKNESRTDKKPFRLGDIQMMNKNKKYDLIALGLALYPATVKKGDREKAEDKIDEIDPTIYIFPNYIYEVPNDSKSWELTYKGKKLVELKGKETKQE